jgi:hypothetical protein
MADYNTILRVAKILAGVTSSNPAESEKSLESAYLRMKHDGVNFEDLLDLPEQELYQEALVLLAVLIVKREPNLSPAEQRERHALYHTKITLKFFKHEEKKTHQETGGAGAPNAQGSRDRESYRREYEERTGGQGSRSTGDRSENEYKRQNGNTAKPDPSSDVSIPFSPARFFSFLIGSNSFLQCIVRFPSLTRDLFVVSIKQAAWVTFLAFVVVFAGFEIVTNATRWVMRLFGGIPLFLLWVFGIATLVTAYSKYERGWYPIRPVSGETDINAVARDSHRAFFWVARRTGQGIRSGIDAIIRKIRK